MTRLVNFHRRSLNTFDDLISEEGRSVSLASLAPRLRMGRDIWVVQAFHVLRGRGHEVRLSDQLDPGAINVLHVDDLDWGRDLWRCFLVTVRADREPAFCSQIEVVQNRASLWGERDIFIPHWPQPGLIPRDPDRGDRIETVVFMGHAFNLAEELRTEGFRAELAEIGVKLVIREKDWWNYRDADVVLGVRGGPPMYLAVKPASKLVNAWLAGCPAILSPEVGYLEQREGPLDYLEAIDAREVVGALRELRSRPDLFRQMVENGRRRAQQFTTEKVADAWEDALGNVIQPSFDRWLGSRPQPVMERLRVAAARARRRLWGTQAIPELPASRVRRAANRPRRALALPRAFWPGRPGERALATVRHR